MLPLLLIAMVGMVSCGAMTRGCVVVHGAEPMEVTVADAATGKQVPASLSVAPAETDKYLGIVDRMVVTRGPMKRKLRTGFQPSFFVLNGDKVARSVTRSLHRGCTDAADAVCAVQLEYYKEEGGAKKGEIVLTAATRVSPLGDVQIVVIDGSTKYVCEAPGNASRDQWVQALMHNVVALRSKGARRCARCCC